jgi:ribulose 1,5-bisphosphate synthetase/thiazole synthase
VQVTAGEMAMSSLLSDIHVEYLVREDGERTGVVLNWQDFQKLRSHLERDPDLLVGAGRRDACRHRRRYDVGSPSTAA